MQFRTGIVADIVWRPLSKYHDQRGWLCELFRDDEVPPEYRPVMAYASVTEPGITRGPHEHVDQADYFCFFGPGTFKLYLWDTRLTSSTHGIFQAEEIGADRPMAVIVPAGVVHAYRNISAVPGLVFNAANRLYKGPGRKEAVDEIRHEDRPDSPFVME